jgi:hypothetical protein
MGSQQITLGQIFTYNYINTCLYEVERDPNIKALLTENWRHEHDCIFSN